jgi:hypothetical protein
MYTNLLARWSKLVQEQYACYAKPRDIHECIINAQDMNLSQGGSLSRLVVDRERRRIYRK